VRQDARLSALVVDVDSGRLVFARHPDSLANPASVSKIFTGHPGLSPHVSHDPAR